MCVCVFACVYVHPCTYGSYRYPKKKLKHNASAYFNVLGWIGRERVAITLVQSRFKLAKEPDISSRPSSCAALSSSGLRPTAPSSRPTSTPVTASHSVTDEAFEVNLLFFDFVSGCLCACSFFSMIARARVFAGNFWFCAVAALLDPYVVKAPHTQLSPTTQVNSQILPPLKKITVGKPSTPSSVAFQDHMLEYLIYKLPFCLNNAIPKTCKWCFGGVQVTVHA